MTGRTKYDLPPMPLDLQVGSQVRLLSGATVGRIGAISAGAFRLDAGSEAAWLLQDAIFTAGVGGVTLACELDGLHRYRSAAGRA